MKHKSHIMHYSLFVGMLVAMSPAIAGIRIGNASRTYADSYNQVNSIRMGTPGAVADQTNAAVGVSAQNVISAHPTNVAIASTSDDGTTDVDISQLPIRVANVTTARRFARGEMVGDANVATLESCARIYPDGEFEWNTPTVGVGSGGANTCVSVVEMRSVGGCENGNDCVLARANVASGDAVRCNISDFPEISYTNNVEKIVFPADSEPTVDDVIRVMNQEQKQNAGLKIAAGALIGGLAGNVIGKGDAGSDSLVGTGKGKMQGTAIGVLSGASLMAGNVYAGKVGGDVILSTGVNAAAGAVVGNIVGAAGSDSILRVEKCKINGSDDTCVLGYVEKSKSFDMADKTAFYNIQNEKTYQCDADKKNCSVINLINIRLEAEPAKELHALKSEKFSAITASPERRFHYDEKTQQMITGDDNNNENVWAKIASANESDGPRVRAMVPGFKEGTFGSKMADWYKWRSDNGKNAKVYGRDASNSSTELGDGFSIDNFTPVVKGADDGGIIDMHNRARMKSTLTGAGVGGAMGGFVAYQGAQSDIDERWVTASREYKDSLQKVYCISGRRFLGYYNDVIQIPSVK